MYAKMKYCGTMMYYLHVQYRLKKLSVEGRTVHSLKEHHMCDKMCFFTHSALKYCPLLAKRSLSFYNFVTSNIQISHFCTRCAAVFLFFGLSS